MVVASGNFSQLLCNLPYAPGKAGGEKEQKQFWVFIIIFLSFRHGEESLSFGGERWC